MNAIRIYSTSGVGIDWPNRGKTKRQTREWLRLRIKAIKPGQTMLIPHSVRSMPSSAWIRNKQNHPIGSDIAVLNRRNGLYIISLQNGNEKTAMLVT